MDVEIKNLDQYSEAERERIEAFLRHVLSALDDEDHDPELRAYLLNFLSGDHASQWIDAAEVMEAEYVKERYNEFVSSRFLVARDNQSLLPPDFSGEDEFDHGQGAVYFDGPDDDASVHQSRNPQPQSKDLDDIPSPDMSIPKNLDVKPDREKAISEHPDASIQPSMSPKQIPTPPHSNTIDFDENADDEVTRLRSENARLRSQGMAPAYDPQGDGGYRRASTGASDHPIESGGDAVSQGFDALAKGAAGLVGGGAAVIGAALGVGGKVLSAAKSSMTALRGEGGFDPEIRQTLSGDSSTVVDMSKHRDLLLNRLAKFRQNPESVKASLQVLFNSQFNAKRQSVLDNMASINQERFSDIEIAPGVTAGAALLAVKNGSPSEAAMAKALLQRADNVPDAAMEMAFLAKAYGHMQEHLTSLHDMAQAEGLSQDAIAEQFGRPLQDWLEHREQEDAFLQQLGEIQAADPGVDISPEDREAARQQMEAVSKAIRELVRKLLGLDKAELDTMKTNMAGPSR